MKVRRAGWRKARVVVKRDRREARRARQQSPRITRQCYVTCAAATARRRRDCCLPAGDAAAQHIRHADSVMVVACGNAHAVAIGMRRPPAVATRRAPPCRPERRMSAGGDRYTMRHNGIFERQRKAKATAYALNAEMPAAEVLTYAISRAALPRQCERGVAGRQRYTRCAATRESLRKIMRQRSACRSCAQQASRATTHSSAFSAPAAASRASSRQPVLYVCYAVPRARNTGTLALLSACCATSSRYATMVSNTEIQRKRTNVKPYKAGLPEEYRVASATPAMHKH